MLVFYTMLVILACGVGKVEVNGSTYIEPHRFAATMVVGCVVLLVIHLGQKKKFN